MRRNLFVPLPTVTDVQAFKRELLDRCEVDWQREHYKKGNPIARLFEDDKKTFLYLPKASFAACRYTRVKTDGYGKFLIDGKHFYSSSPEWAGRELVVRTTLSRLLHSLGAWRNSLIRTALPEWLREEMDGLDRAQLKEALHTMQDLSGRYDFDTTLQAMEQAATL